MVEEAHRIFGRWAAWVLAPVPGDSLGYGKNILVKIMEGRGMIQPSAPRGSYVRVATDVVAMEVVEFMKGLDRYDSRLIKLFYLDQRTTVEQKAHRMYVSRKQFYLDLDRIHRAFLAQRCSDQV
jgi:hypothetical protein